MCAVMRERGAPETCAGTLACCDGRRAARALTLTLELCPLTGWSMFLAMFSIMGAARTLPEFMHTLYTHGFYHSLCIPSFIENDRVSGFWTWMFVLSKVYYI